MNHVPSLKPLSIACLPLLLTACAGTGDLDETGGIKTVRSACPAVAIPAATGDLTLFDPAARVDADAVDVVAAITNLRSTCTTVGERITAAATFDVHARRSATAGARTVTLPYFAVVTRAGSDVRSKQIGTVTLRFEDGQARAQGSASASADISMAEASLPPEIEQRINRKRKAGDADAAVDPMTDPEVRKAVQKASFELLVGFQLDDAQLRYNATR